VTLALANLDLMLLSQKVRLRLRVYRQALQLLLSTVFFLVNAITVMLCAALRATIASLISQWVFVCWPTSQLLSKQRKPAMG
jgi:hypothetical protein